MKVRKLNELCSCLGDKNQTDLVDGGVGGCCGLLDDICLVV